MLDFNNSLNFEDAKSFKFKSFGVRVEINATHKIHLIEIHERLKILLPENFELIDNQDVEHSFTIEFVDEKILKFHQNGKDSSESESKDILFNYLESKIRLTVAEYAVCKVFIHAGVVAFNNQAIIIPASSYQGKTTLVKEFLKIGATYYSDEYAVLDEKGFVHPFPKTLSVRGIIDKYQQVECVAESFGGTIGTVPIPAKMILLTEFSEGAVWEPKLLDKGPGILEVIPHTLPIRLRPKFTLQVLNKVASRAIICKSLRGEAKTSAEKILEFFELNT